MLKDCSFKKLMSVLLFFLFAINGNAQSIENWYANAQQRIDTLRKGNFGIKLVDKDGQALNGRFSLRLKKHEFPFGIAFDLYEGAVSNGNTYKTSSKISAPIDAEIYESERWYNYIAYAIPVIKDKKYKLTLKFAEIYFDTKGARLFNAFVEGNKFLSDYDVLDEAGGKNIGKDTSLTLTANDNLINIEFVAIVDNAAVKGIEVENLEDHSIVRINCGGENIVTANGHTYESDEKYFDLSASRMPSEEQWMKATMQKYFNYGVSGNSFKWSGIQPQHKAPDYTAFDNAVKWTKSIGWELRAHTLLWGGYEYTSDHELPRWVKDLPNPRAITDTCKMRVIREVTHYKGIIKEYDVMNEPLHAKYLSSVVGDSINWNCFKWARSADPDARLFINDYNVEYNWGDAKKYRDLIIKMKSLGAPVTGVGMQAHFWDNMRPQLTELVTNINIVAEAGLPIKLTEFDNGNISEEAQASDLAMVTTIAFSHPSINGIIYWGLSDKGAWRKNSGLFDANHKPKLAADTFFYLTKKLWSTNIDSVFSGNDINFNAYYGNYEVEVNLNGIIKVFNIPCLKENRDSVFVLREQDAVLKSPQFLTSQLISDSSLKISFDKKIDAQSISKGDFKFFSNNPIRIQKVDIDKNDSTSIIVRLQNFITPGDYISVSYFPGSLAAMDGSKSNAFGPEMVKNKTTGLIKALVINDGNAVEAEFNRKIENIDQNLSSFSLLVNGKNVALNAIEYKTNDSAKVLLTSSEKILPSDKLTVKYTAGTLVAVDGFDCQSSGSTAVLNFWPKLVSAEIPAKGNKLVILFNCILEDIQSNKQAFTITVNGTPVQFTEVLTTGKDSSKLSFLISASVTRNAEVKVSYIPGSLKTWNGNSLPKFENIVVSNKSNVTAINQIEQGNFSIFPNPAKNMLNISSENNIHSTRIFNCQGLEIYKTMLHGRTGSIDVSSFPKGVYTVQLIDDNGKIQISTIVLE